MSETFRSQVQPEPSSATPQSPEPQQSQQTPESQPEPGASPATPPESVIPEKFGGSAEKLAQAYRELEAKLAEQSQQTPEGQQTQQTPESQQTPEGQDRPEGLKIEPRPEGEPGGLSAEAFAPFVDEYHEHGKLSDESFAKIEELGVSRDMAEGYIAGQYALAAQIQQRAYDIVGGQDNYAAMAQWAANNLGEQELSAFNRAVESSDEGARAMAIRGLHAQFQASRKPSSPALLSGDNNPNASAAPFQSRAQMTQAINDPRYQKDPAYRAEVEKRIQASRIL